MGGGSDSKKRGEGGSTPGSSTPGTPLPAYGGAPTARTFQPYLPGFDSMIARQLAAGYGSGGGTAPDFASMINNMYRPMTLQQFSEPISTTAAAYKEGKFAPISTGNLTLDKLLMGQKLPGAKDEKSSEDEKGRR